MFIMPLPWNRSDLELLRDTHHVFDLIMKDSTQQNYLIIQDNKITWVAQGTVPGKAAYQIQSRSLTINGASEIPKNLGNVGFLGKYSGIEDAILKVFPKNGYCVSSMEFASYTGQKLKGKKDHYSVLTPITCLLGDQPSAELKHFFQILGWGNRKCFACSGTWRNMNLLIDGKTVSTLEEWFTTFCSISLN